MRKRCDTISCYANNTFIKCCVVFRTHEAACCEERLQQNDQQATSVACETERRVPDLHMRVLVACLNTSQPLGLITYLINM